LAALYVSRTDRRQRLGQRSDIFRVTLFEMVGGRPPSKPLGHDLMMMHVNDPVPDLHS
jgi:hypothetical protein